MFKRTKKRIETKIKKRIRASLALYLHDKLDIYATKLVTSLHKLIDKVLGKKT